MIVLEAVKAHMELVIMNALIQVQMMIAVLMTPVHLHVREMV
jgi:hypothetical protein